MKIITIAVIEHGDFKPESNHVKMKDITKDDLSVDIPNDVDLVITGPPTNSNGELCDRLVKEFDKYGSFCELKKVKK